MDKIIAITTWRRPDMYLKVLNALAQCTGIENYKILNILDLDKASSSFQLVHEMVDQSHALKSQIVTLKSDHNTGCAGSMRRALTEGFKYNTDFVAVLEDDTIPAKDWLQFLEFSAEQFRDDPRVFCVNAWNRRTDNPDIQVEINLIGTKHGVMSYQAWGIWRRIWDEVKDNWFGIHWIPGYKHPEDQGSVPEGEAFLKIIRKDDTGSWSYPMRKYFSQGRLEAFPYISRSQNIGDTRGCFNPDPNWHKTHMWSPVWADQVTADYFKVVE